MKFKKLQIQNINSIAETVIDFEHLMPQGQHIFMIWGPSGAGKSTILDAICMALFCKTPRLQSIAEKKENQYQDPEFQFSDKNKGIAINDLRQYLKRGTKEGFCSLQFVGNDSVTYTAKTSFSINRKNNLNPIEWSLISENGVWSKVKEIEQQIVTVTGLTYEQFCRTTLLAQGEFTKFMKSDQNAKAEILEKLTDTSVFSEIGRKIFEKYSHISKEYDKLNRENENVVRLSDEQIAEYGAQINTVENETKQLDTAIDSYARKSNWLKQFAVFQEDVLHSETLWKEANVALHSEEIQKTRHFIEQWEQTETERGILLDIRGLRFRTIELNKTEKEYELQYQRLTSGYRFLQETIIQTDAAKKQLIENLDKQAYRSETYANAQSLCEKLKQYAQIGLTISKNKDKHRQNLLLLTTSEPVLAQKQSEISGKQAETDKLSDELRDLKEKLNAFDLSQLTLLQAERKDALRDLTEANKAVLTLKNQQSEIREFRKTLAEQQQLVETLTVQMRQEQGECTKAQSARETAQNVYDSAAKSVHDFAKQVRATLQIGDICPVCGQKVAQLLTNEAAEESLHRLKTTLDEAKETEKTAKKRYDETVTKLGTAQNIVASRQTDLQKKTQKFNADFAALKELCQRLYITIDETIQEQINQQLAYNENVLKEIEGKIALSRNLNQQVEKTNAGLDKAKKELEDLRKCYHEAELQVTKLQEENKVLQAHWHDGEKQQTDLQTEISGFLSTTYPKWAEDPTRTAQSLIAEAKEYEKSQEKLAKLQESAEKLKNEQHQIERFQQQVRALFDWPNAGKPQIIDRLVEEWADFVPKCSVLSQNTISLRADIANKESALQTFYADHLDIQEDTLTRLASTARDTIAQLRGQLADAQNRVQNTYGQFQKAQESMKKHQETKPMFEEGENLALIEAKITAMNQQKTEKTQFVGQIRHILCEDERNKQQYSETLRQLDMLLQEVRQWERLNNIFGDSTGKTFRKIAQSYILQKLLDNTNYFLAMLSDRYELTGAGRELMILVKDKYLSDAPRPVEMVSGGESFLISIALALGLSNLALQGVSSDFLFIDEGISQLDGSLCDSVVNTLQQLHHIVHCNIGIISHLDILADKIPTKIVVQPISHGTSEVVIRN